MLAGGIGNRMSLNKPKQFEIVGDKPILIHSTETFLKVEEIDKIIVSSPKEYINETKELIHKYFSNNPRIVVIIGGKTRNDTILNSSSIFESILATINAPFYLYAAYAYAQSNLPDSAQLLLDAINESALDNTIDRIALLEARSAIAAVRGDKDRSKALKEECCTI